MTVTERLGGFLASRTSRRSFLARATLGATALSVAPLEYLLRPRSAYAQICECAPGYDCDCSALCCDGYTQFCCTINDGINACPPGTFAGGWWQAEGSIYCAGTRYYIDCMGRCQTCGCGGGNFCPGCDGLTCECALGNCNNRHVGCTEFRYGQCNEQIDCTGVIACRVVSCTPPWDLGYPCSTVSYTDNSTADHFAPCQDGPTSYPAGAVGMAATATSEGYWLVDSAGWIRTFGDAVSYGSLVGITLAAPIVGMSATPDGRGYWLVGSDGGIFAFGDAGFDGSTGNIKLVAPIVAMTDGGRATTTTTPPTTSTTTTPPTTSTTTTPPTTSTTTTPPTTSTTTTPPTTSTTTTPPTTSTTTTPPTTSTTTTTTTTAGATGASGGDSPHGYRFAASDGGVFDYDVPFYGSAGTLRLAKPVVGMAVTPTGRGYWLVAADGGIFCYGDAGFHGCAADIDLGRPIVGMAATRTGNGYWLVAADGGIFCYGDAGFHGCAADIDLAQPIVGLTATLSGEGYWLVAADGGIFCYGNAGFFGSGMG